MPPELYDEILERITGRIGRQYTWYRESLEEGLKLAATLRHLVSGTTVLRHAVWVEGA